MLILARVGRGLGGPGSELELASSSCRKQRDGAMGLDGDHVTGCIRMDYGSVCGETEVAKRDGSCHWNECMCPEMMLACPGEWAQHIWHR